jgi:hypothetical protein
VISDTSRIVNIFAFPFAILRKITDTLIFNKSDCSAHYFCPHGKI